MKTIHSSDFKARCLALLDFGQKTWEGITILKRGRPVAQIVPVVPRDEGYPQQSLAGTIEILRRHRVTDASC